jgi:hypothetical protein
VDTKARPFGKASAAHKNEKKKKKQKKNKKDERKTELENRRRERENDPSCKSDPSRLRRRFLAYYRENRRRSAAPAINRSTATSRPSSTGRLYNVAAGTKRKTRHEGRQKPRPTRISLFSMYQAPRAADCVRRQSRRRSSLFPSSFIGFSFGPSIRKGWTVGWGAARKHEPRNPSAIGPAALYRGA